MEAEPQKEKPANLTCFSPQLDILRYKEQRPMIKLLAFKLVVTLALLQQITFRILEGADALNSTDTLTYADLNVGIPSMLSCIEMVPISLVVVHAYPVTPYLLRRDTQTARAGQGGTKDCPGSY